MIDAENDPAQRIINMAWANVSSAWSNAVVPYWIGSVIIGLMGLIKWIGGSYSNTLGGLLGAAWIVGWILLGQNARKEATQDAYRIEDFIHEMREQSRSHLE